jgi:stress-induced morphogen
MTQQHMLERLKVAYPDGKVEVIDTTGTNDHWEVYVESKAFQNLSRIQAHQNVMGHFSHELMTGEVHALSIKTKVLQE